MPERNRLPREFFMTDALVLSQALLGKIMVHRTPYGTVRGIITETEAYMGVEDKGSHTYKGCRTERTEPMFHIGGTSYVYFIYGMYHCMNITAGEAEIPQAALIRAVEPADEASRKIMEKLRAEKLSRRKKAKAPEHAGTQSAGMPDKGAIEQPERGKDAQLPPSVRKHLADGPGKLCIAMDITKKDNDVDMVESKDFFLTEGMEVKEAQIAKGKRIGIDYAEEAADYLWRFTLKLSDFGRRTV